MPFMWLCSDTHFSDRWLGTGDEFLLRLSASKCFSLAPLNPFIGTLIWELWWEYEMASFCSLRSRFLNVYLRVEFPAGDNGRFRFRYFRRSLFESSMNKSSERNKLKNCTKTQTCSTKFAVNSRFTLTKFPSSFSFFVYFLLPVITSMLYFRTFLSSPTTVRVAVICLCSSSRAPEPPLVSSSISRVTCFMMVFGDDFNIFDCHSGMFMMASRWMLLETSAIWHTKWN